MTHAPILMTHTAVRGFWHRSAAVWALDVRNITITSAVSNSYDTDAMPVLDMESRVGILQLCSSCTFLFAHVSINNENPAGTGGGMTVFRGQQGSKVDRVGGAGWRLACPPARQQLELLNLSQRSIQFPNPPPAKQQVQLVNVTYKVSQLARGGSIASGTAVGSVTAELTHSMTA